MTDPIEYLINKVIFLAEERGKAETRANEYNYKLINESNKLIEITNELNKLKKDYATLSEQLFTSTQKQQLATILGFHKCKDLTIPDDIWEKIT